MKVTQIKYDYPWCASPLYGLNILDRIKVFKHMIKSTIAIKANVALFSSN